MSITAMKQALEALEAAARTRRPELIKQAITALRTAIEAAESSNCDSPSWCNQYRKCHRNVVGALQLANCIDTTPPAAPRQWIGLTEIEICDIEVDELPSASSETFSFARAIEAKLKEKNSG
jgi:hypothetical protein